MVRKYNGANDFIDDCNMGLDIEFSYNNIGYGVLGWLPGGPLAYRKDAYGYYEQQFDSPEMLLDGFKIDGHPLRDIITEIQLD